MVAELVHLGGLGILLLQLKKKKTAAGISLKTQQLTVIFLSVRFYCSLMMEKDIHTLLDLLTLFGTIAAIVYISNNLMSTYAKADDTLKLSHLVRSWIPPPRLRSNCVRVVFSLQKCVQCLRVWWF